MSTVAPTRLMTVEEFAKLPEPIEGRYELRHGEPILVTWPRMRHTRLQAQIFSLLQPLSRESVVMIELPFRPHSQHELWRADVAAVTRERWDAADLDGWIMGSPELVIEIISPSNTSDEIDDREQTVLGAGGKEFWVVYPSRRQIRVTTAEGTIRRYTRGDQIPVGNGHIAVDDIFSVIG